MCGTSRPSHAGSGRPRLHALLLVAALVSVIAGCGAAPKHTGTDTTAVTSPDTIAGHEFERFPSATPPATAALPAPPRTQGVEADYLRALFNDAQNFWRREFRAARLVYRGARVVVFSGKVSTGCGDGSGAFYCPPDGVYLDTEFFKGLVSGQPAGPAAQAYIVGHEIAHHIQRLVGVAARVHAANEADPAGKNARSVQVELQADCLSGVWARSAFPRSQLTATDLREALKTADAIGDDYAARARGEIIDPATSTHGSSAQRQHWLTTGFTGGRPADCNTFAER